MIRICASGTRGWTSCTLPFCTICKSTSIWILILPVSFRTGCWTSTSLSVKIGIGISSTLGTSCACDDDRSRCRTCSCHHVTNMTIVCTCVTSIWIGMENGSSRSTFRTCLSISRTTYTRWFTGLAFISVSIKMTSLTSSTSWSSVTTYITVRDLTFDTLTLLRSWSHMEFSRFTSRTSILIWTFSTAVSTRGTSRNW